MTTVVSLREINDATLRALKTHGASHGEAATAARMVVEAEIIEGSGLNAVLDDLAREPWSSSPVQITPLSEVPEAHTVVFGSASSNRLLREGPLTAGLVAGDSEVDVVGARGAVVGLALLDPVLLEIARTDGSAIAVVVCTTAWSASGIAPAGATGLSAHVRLAQPDGELLIAVLDDVPALCLRVLDGPGVLALRDLTLLGDRVPNWIPAADRADLRARAAADGLAVDTEVWQAVRVVAHRYLVPD